MNNVYKMIGAKISELRNDYGSKGISQESLAQEVGTTANTISRWEKAIYKPSADDLLKLANFFGVSISVFFPNMSLRDKQQALLSATGDLDDRAMDEIIEYAKFRKAREVLREAGSKRGRKNK